MIGFSSNTNNRTIGLIVQESFWYFFPEITPLPEPKLAF